MSMERPNVESRNSSTVSVEQAIRRELKSLSGGERVSSSAILRAAEAGNAKRLELESQGRKNELNAMNRAFTPDMRRALDATRRAVPSSDAPMPVATAFLKSGGSVVGPDAIQSRKSNTRS